MATIEISSQAGKDFSGDVLIVPVFSGRERHRLPLAISKVARQVMDENDFKADNLELVPLHHPNGVKDCRWMLLVGLGEEEGVTLNKIRKAVGVASRHCLKRGWKTVGVIVPSTSSMEHDEVQVAVLEGVLLGDYDFCAYKGNPEPKAFTKVELFTNGEDTRKVRRRLPQLEAGVEACHQVRNWVNAPASDLNPDTFAAAIKHLAGQHKLGITVLEGEALRKDGFNAVLAVGKGSTCAPRVIKLEYKPTGEKPKKSVVLVGKGVCYDAGGLCTKSYAGLEEGKNDMAGAAIVVATMVACAQAQVPVHVVGIVGLAENMPSGSAMKPGDVIRSRSGKTIEVVNTDAEGRLMLADLLHYASQITCDHLVDLATLTGACTVALGDGVSGVLGEDQKLVDRLMDSGLMAGEHLWQLPLVSDYRQALNSKVADIKHISGQRYGDAILAAMFLKEFVNHPSWAHVDLSSVWSRCERDYRPHGATGEGPRWLLEWLSA